MTPFSLCTSGRCWNNCTMFQSTLNPCLRPNIYGVLVTHISIQTVLCLWSPNSESSEGMRQVNYIAVATKLFTISLYIRNTASVSSLSFMHYGLNTWTFRDIPSMTLFIYCMVTCTVSTSRVLSISLPDYLYMYMYCVYVYTIDLFFQLLCNVREF